MDPTDLPISHGHLYQYPKQPKRNSAQTPPTSPLRLLVPSVQLISIRAPTIVIPSGLSEFSSLPPSLDNFLVSLPTPSTMCRADNTLEGIHRHPFKHSHGRAIPPLLANLHRRVIRLGRASSVSETSFGQLRARSRQALQRTNFPPHLGRRKRCLPSLLVDHCLL